MEILSPQGTSRTSTSGEAIDALPEGSAKSAAPVSHFQSDTGMAAGQAFGGPPEYEGCNVGIKAALEAGAEFVWLLNNDTTVDPAAESSRGSE